MHLGSQIPDNSKKVLGYESYHAAPPPPTGLFSPPKLDLSYYSLEEFKQPMFEGYGPKTSKNVSEDIPNEFKEYPDAPLVKDRVTKLMLLGKLTTAIDVNAIEADTHETTAWNEFSSTMASAIICLATNQKFNFFKYIFDHMVKNLEDGVKFLMFPRFVQVFPDSQVEEMLKHKEIYVTPSHTKKIFANMKRVFTLETTKASQALEIGSLKRRVKKLEKKVSKKTHKLKILYKIGSSTRVKSSEDAGLGDQEDASKQGRMIIDLDVDEGVALVDKTQERNGQDMFDTSILDDEEVVAEKEVSTADPVPTTSKVVTTAGEVVTTAGVETSKPKSKGIVIQVPNKTPTPIPIDSFQQPSKAKDNGKAKMIEPKKPLKRKDQIMINEEVARNLEAQMQVELDEEERISRQKEEQTNIALIESWNNIQAMMGTDYELTTRLQEEERGELTLEEKSRLFVKLIDKRVKYFARLRAKKIRKLVKGSEKTAEGSEKIA
uniref:Uncharacterized protein n=1 Tax=Tanacetum cinerariifolium TaxID=118510 RepID=A0A699HBG4_TANCI|nr:hypothetical protein [Tanacetum cinerariifolium]